MKRMKIEEKKNGVVVTVDGFIKISGEYVYKNTELITMLEFIGENIMGSKIKVELK